MDEREKMHDITAGAFFCGEGCPAGVPKCKELSNCGKKSLFRMLGICAGRQPLVMIAVFDGMNVSLLWSELLKRT